MRERLASQVDVALLWQHGPQQGRIEVIAGTLTGLAVEAGVGQVDKDHFAFSGSGECRLNLAVRDAWIGPGADPARVTVRTGEFAFTFLLRDVHAGCPIWLADNGIAVTQAADRRTYDQISRSVRDQKLQTRLDQIAAAPEAGYEQAAAHVRHLYCPTWLGVSRDFRLFEIACPGSPAADATIRPRFHGRWVELDEFGDRPVCYSYVLGGGHGAVQNVSRRLAGGVLPILQGTVDEGSVQYRFEMFASLEGSPLCMLRGTSFWVADGFAHHEYTPEQEALFQSLIPEALDGTEEIILYMQVRAANMDRVPRYSLFKAPYPRQIAYTYDQRTGFGALASGRVFCVSRLNGSPLPQGEMAVLLQPGEEVVYTCYLPHRPIPAERAAVLACQDYGARRAECSAFWEHKLDQGAQIRLPERRIDEMLHAGLLHLDLIAFGRQPDEPLTAAVGVYPSIGSESAPIIQFMDSMGWHREAERAIDCFLAKQRPAGNIETFFEYKIETGAVLWSIGEHYRYTRDTDWVRRIEPQVRRACAYLLDWRQRNQDPRWLGTAYGLLDGKVADPEDPFHVFMLNGYACMGLSRVAQMMAPLDPAYADQLAAVAAALRDDIRTALFAAMARSPVVPLGDGTWCPSAPPWPEGSGPAWLHVENQDCYTHGTFFTRDSLLGPLYLIYQEVLDPHEPAADWLVRAHAELMCQHGVAYSQPYYSRHPSIHLQRGEVKAFLQAFYNGLASLADRETYTFWEHYYGVSPHKTHEEGWFLMQLRSMLYVEQGDTLRLLPGIPRAWLVAGQSLDIAGAASYWGPFDLHVTAYEDRIEARVRCRGSRTPAAVEIRLPHPQGQRPIHVSGGDYIPDTESVCFSPLDQERTVTLFFAPTG